MASPVSVRRLVLAVLFGASAACAPAAPATSTPAPAELSGGVLATFAVGDETFKVWVTNPTTIDQLLALQAGESAATIPNGVLAAGPGEGDHNSPWSWHLDPQDIELAELTTEVCDGEPSYVEANLADFTEQVGRYCPWSAQLTGLEDRR